MESEERAGETPQKPSDRRKSPRFGVEEDATLSLVSHGSRQPCTVLDLSLTGCRLKTRERFRAGSMVRVEVNFKVRGLAFRFGGVIQWTDGRYMIGVQFVDVIERRRVELAEALGEIKDVIDAKAREEASKAEKAGSADAGATGAEQPTATPAVEVFSIDWARGAKEKVSDDPLAALRVPGGVRKAPGQVVPISAPEAAAKPEEPAVAPPVKRERRTQARHEVDTSAVNFVVKSASRLDGRILDLSLNVCRIRTHEPFPLGIYTRIETEFHIEGLPFRLGGVIQALHDRYHVGIRFLDMSPRKQEQLQQLIVEIEEMRSEKDE